jgi:regulator of nucleoside diphosphate kinase
MSTTSSGEATLTELDHVRITALARRAPLPPVLRELLDVADLVPVREVPGDVVTMYAKLQLAGADGQTHTRVVCYPEDADPDAGFVSVLSPLGTALIGRRVGDTVVWSTPDGREHSATVAAVTFQPESSGDFTT